MKLRRLPRGIPLVLAVVLMVMLADPRTWTLIAGGVVLLAGLALRGWAAGHLRRNEELATSGPYAHLRDPLYLGRLLILVGLAFMAFGWALLLLPVGLAIFFLDYMPRKKRKEMARLTKFFGEEYRTYAAEVSALWPRLRPWPGARDRRFSWRLYFLENREPWLHLALAPVVAALVTRWLDLWSPPW